MPAIMTHAVAAASLARMLVLHPHRRGVTHSLAFALTMGLAAWAGFRKANVGSPVRNATCIALAAASHATLEAFTNGGHGVAFFAPFTDARYFFPFAPIEISPIGLAFFSERGMRVLISELAWVWLPALVVLIAPKARGSPRNFCVTREASTLSVTLRPLAAPVNPVPATGMDPLCCEARKSTGACSTPLAASAVASGIAFDGNVAPVEQVNPTGVYVPVNVPGYTQAILGLPALKST